MTILIIYSELSFIIILKVNDNVEATLINFLEINCLINIYKKN